MGSFVMCVCVCVVVAAAVCVVVVVCVCSFFVVGGGVFVVVLGECF